MASVVPKLPNVDALRTLRAFMVERNVLRKVTGRSREVDKVGINPPNA